jgi:hypothetical protein
MALVHYLYIGHFIPEQGYVRFQGHKPAVMRPINKPTVDGLLKKYLGESANLDALPEQWAMSILPDYVVCDRLASPAAALSFAADYASQEGATILDMGAFSLMTPEQLRQSATVLRHAQPA